MDIVTNLFCIPFSGGNKYSYNDFVRSAPPNMAISALELPGRGSRVNEPLITDIHELTADIYATIVDQLSTPYALYGHSMGARVLYLLTKLILENKNKPPIHLFVSGSPGPSHKNKTVFHDLPSNEFKKILLEMGGSQKEIFEDKELFTFYEPIIRADFEILDTYEYEPALPFEIPITVLIGKDENINYSLAKTWQNETTAIIEIYEFNGNHFFIYDHAPSILKLIDRKLQRPVVL